MMQAAIRPSTGSPGESAGNIDVVTVSRREARKIELNAGGTSRADVIDELAGNDADRLGAIAGRAEGMKAILGILSSAPELGDDAQTVLRQVRRDVDAIFALAIQAHDEYRFAS